jgi:prepilin-type N-terminal cleavage/methylation domain-containing protein
MMTMMLRNSKGFSLVEVMIALIIMSVGMLGIAGLYVQSMQAGRTSMLRHHAVTLAGDIADRIRAKATLPTASGPIQLQAKPMRLPPVPTTVALRLVLHAMRNRWPHTISAFGKRRRPAFCHLLPTSRSRLL